MRLNQRNRRTGTTSPMDPSDSGTKRQRLGFGISQTRLVVAVISCLFFAMSMNSFHCTDVYTDLDVNLRTSPSEASATATSNDKERTKENKGTDNVVANLQMDLDPMANVFPACTSEELATMQSQIKSLERQTRCPDPNWIEDFYYLHQDGLELGSHDGSFLGITIGCNKAFDAINTARMGMNNPVFSKKQWKEKLESYGVAVRGACKQDSTPHFVLKNSEPRPGEMHCVEPMPSTVEMLSKAAKELNLGQEGFVVTKAAISSRGGKAYFPSATTKAGVENINMDGCNSKNEGCEAVPMYSLQTYVENYVTSTGPINILSVDVEGFDFDVLFGAGSVLDRTQYLEFEYHQIGHWGKLHLHDLVNLLDLKGFNCYWAGREKLWRITNCQLEHFDTWHGWSNVACVHRSQDKLAQSMERLFLATIGKPKPPS